MGARFGEAQQLSSGSKGAEFSIGEINNCDADRVWGQHRLVEVRPDIPQLCYIHEKLLHVLPDRAGLSSAGLKRLTK